MRFQEALEIMKRGGRVARGGQIFCIRRGVAELLADEGDGVTHRPADLSDRDRDAEDWEEAREVASSGENISLMAESEPPPPTEEAPKPKPAKPQAPKRSRVGR
jgi:hypothetical protein